MKPAAGTQAGAREPVNDRTAGNATAISPHAHHHTPAVAGDQVAHQRWPSRCGDAALLLTNSPAQIIPPIESFDVARLQRAVSSRMLFPFKCSKCSSMSRPRRAVPPPATPPPPPPPREAALAVCSTMATAFDRNSVSVQGGCLDRDVHASSAGRLPHRSRGGSSCSSPR